MMLTHLGVHSIGHESGTAVALEQVNKELPALSEQLIQQGIQIRNQQLLQQCQQSSGRILSIQCPIEDNSTSAV